MQQWHRETVLTLSTPSCRMYSKVKHRLSLSALPLLSRSTIALWRTNENYPNSLANDIRHSHIIRPPVPRHAAASNARIWRIERVYVQFLLLYAHARIMVTPVHQRAFHAYPMVSCSATVCHALQYRSAYPALCYIFCSAACRTRMRCRTADSRHERMRLLSSWPVAHAQPHKEASTQLSVDSSNTHRPMVFRKIQRGTTYLRLRGRMPFRMRKRIYLPVC